MPAFPRVRHHLGRERRFAERCDTAWIYGTLQMRARSPTGRWKSIRSHGYFVAFLVFRRNGFRNGLFRDLLVVIDWLETHIVLAESPGRLWPKAIRTSWARLFAWAGRVRYAWRPAATRTMVRETVAAARQPTRIDGAIPSFC